MHAIIRAARSTRLAIISVAAVFVMAAGVAMAGTNDPALTLKQSAAALGVTDFKVVPSGSPAGLPKALISNNNANWDGADGLSSEHNTYVTDSRAADDVVPPAAGCTQVYSVTAATGVFLTYPGMVSNANLEIYCQDPAGSCPGECEPICTANTTNNTFLGAAFGFYDIRRYNFNGITGCRLDPGTKYYVSIVQNGGAGQGFWATACSPTLCFGDGACFKSADSSGFDLTPTGVPCSPTCFPTWTPDSAIFGTPRDLAFTLSANCVPGTPNACPDCSDCDSDCAPSVDEAKLKAYDAAAGDNFGISVSVSGDTAVVGAWADDDAGSTSGSAYVFERSSGAWTSAIPKLTAFDAEPGDKFGVSVSVSGDTAVVGALFDDDDGADSGSAYVFERLSGVWTFVKKLTAAPDAFAGDNFGTSVSVSGEIAVVGSSEDDDGGVSSGSAYVFERLSGVWTFVKKLTAPDAAAGDHFGTAVSVSGETAVVGALADDDVGANSGSAYVFERSGGAWPYTAKLTPSAPADGNQFGGSVSVSCDTVVVGAVRDDDAGPVSGSAYVFERLGGTWSLPTKFTAYDAAAGDQFGVSVSVSGDTAVVGASADSDAGSFSGSAYNFVRSGGVWTPQLPKLTAYDAATLDQFGLSVSVSEDTTVVGALYDDTTGSAYVFVCPVNQPPSCEASADKPSCGSVQLHANASDPDGDIASIAWSSLDCPDANFSPGASDPDPTIDVAPACRTCTFDLLVTDATGATCADSLTVEFTDKKAPSIRCCGKAGPCDDTRDPKGGKDGCSVKVGCGQEVCLFASATDDCGPVTITNSLTGDNATGPTFASLSFTTMYESAGTYPVTFTATDGCGNTSTCTVSVVVEDKTGPDINCGTYPFSPVPIVLTVGDDDNFNHNQPSDDSYAGKCYTLPCASPAGTQSLDSLQANRCTVWHFDEYRVPPDACVVGATLQIHWKFLEYACVNCGGGVSRPTESISFESCGCAPLTFDSCFDPFGKIMYGGGCPAAGTVGTSTLNLGLFPGVIDLLNGTELTVRLADDTAVDYAVLSINYAFITPVAAEYPTNPGKCCALVPLAACAHDACSCPTTITHKYDHKVDENPNSTGQNLLACFPVGTTTVTFTATDASGNKTDCEAKIEVVDREPPILTCPPSASTVLAGPRCTAAPTSASATDNCDREVEVTANPLILSGTGDHVVTYTATDSSGNSSTCTTTITVVDNTPPSIRCCVKAGPCDGKPGCHDKVEVECGQEVCLSATAADNCGPVTITNSLTGDNATGPTFASLSFTHVFPTIGSYIVTFTATDGATPPNSSTCTVIVVVTGHVFTLKAGVCDKFAPQNGTESTAPSPALTACILANTSNPLLQFDQVPGLGGVPANSWLGHTFTGLPQGITAATLTIVAKATNGFGSNGTFNDSISLQLAPGCTFRWANRLADVPHAPAGCAWNPGTTYTVTLNLAALPVGPCVNGNPSNTTMSILPYLNDCGSLDVMIQDDSGVDCMTLKVTGCPCTTSPCPTGCVGPMGCKVCPAFDVALPAPTTTSQAVAGAVHVGSCTMYKVDLQAGTTYMFTMCGPCGYAAFDSVMSLFDPGCVLVAQNNDFCMLRSQITFAASVTGSYYLGVASRVDAVGCFGFEYKQL